MTLVLVASTLQTCYARDGDRRECHALYGEGSLWEALFAASQWEFAQLCYADNTSLCARAVYCGSRTVGSDVKSTDSLVKAG